MRILSMVNFQRPFKASVTALVLITGLTEAHADSEAATSAPVDAKIIEILTTRWPGPYGGLPPLDRATAPALEAAFTAAVNAKRAEIHAIVSNPAKPTFENTVAAFDASGLALTRVQALLGEMLGTASTEQLRAASARVLPLAASLDADIASDENLFWRIDAVYKGLPESAPPGQGGRLVTVIHDDFVRRGAGLDTAKKTRLKEINALLATLTSDFSQNTSREEEALVVYVADVGQLEGLSDDRIAAAKAAATKRGHPDQWAIPIQRPTVWPVLTKAESRSLRERVFHLWESRGNNRNAFDNAPVMTEILKLRGEKARLMGYPSYAEFATRGRMAGTPQVANAMMERAWQLLLPRTREEIAGLQAIADADHANITIEPWDRLYYAEKFRQHQFGLDGDAVRPYLTLQNVIDAMMWAAGHTYELTFREIHEVPVVAPDVRVYEVSRSGRPFGVVYLDLFQRTGKGPSSWTEEFRSAQRGAANILPIAVVHSNVVHPADKSPPLLSWEVANVIFHEFGHALHMLSSRAEYRALDILSLPWDFIEVPSLLNERWLLDRNLLARFAHHYKTGEPIPPALIDKVEQALKHDRVFSVNLDYLATSMVDMRVHQLADGRAIDAVAEERRILAELGTPPCVTPLLPISSAFHTFSEAYGAGVYTYLWSDAIAADIAEVFLGAAGELYDREVARRYRHAILESGDTTPILEAFRQFRGHDPNPDALFRRFDLLPAPVNH